MECRLLCWLLFYLTTVESRKCGKPDLPCSPEKRNFGGKPDLPCSPEKRNCGGKPDLPCSPEKRNCGGKPHQPCSPERGNCGGSKQCLLHNQRQSNRRNNVEESRCCMSETNNLLKNGTQSDAINAMELLEKVLEETEMSDTTAVSESRFVTLLHKPDGAFKGLEIHASDEEATANTAVPNSTVTVRLPSELNAGPNNTIVFCMLTWPEANVTELGAEGVLYESRLVGLSVGGMNVSGLLHPVTITMHLSTNETQTPRCVFLNFSTKTLSSDGCMTQWAGGPGNVTCCCNHLTYFGVLMVSSSTVTQQNQEILTYITMIGCSLSLVALVITVVLFVTNRKIRADVTMKVHFNLVIALILLNVHFLPSQWVAALPSTGFCVYMALSLHYSLLATFSWMALEGFHLYLLLIRVFNIYITRYLLKVGLVGWGVPAVIVVLVVISDRGSYGAVALDDNNNSSKICYIVNPAVKMGTTVGVFALVFVFNMIMLVVTVKHIVGLSQRKEFGHSERHKAKRGVCTLLGVTTLLGITWGLIFFSFGSLTTPGLYLFCILNPLQGFFIFMWFVLSLRKSRNPTTTTTTTTSSGTRSTNS